MPTPLAANPSADLDELDQWSATAPVSQDARLREEFGHWGPTQTVVNAFREDFSPEGFTGVSEPDVEQQIDSETANQRYGVPGYLRFNAPVVPADAAFQQNMAYERQYRDQVLSRSAPNTLMDVGASLAGALTDPTNVGLAVATSGLGEGVLGAFGLGEAADATAAVTRVGRLATLAAGAPRTLAVGAIDQVPFVGANAFLSNLAGDDYDFGDGLRDIAAGAVLHTGIHTALRAAGAFARGVNPEGLPPEDALAAARAGGSEGSGLPGSPASGPEIGPEGQFNESVKPLNRADLMGSSALTPYVPAAVDALPPAARYAAWAIALDRMTADEPVRVGELIARDQAPPALDRLNENSALVDLPGFRPGEDATAVTTRGTEVPVRYGLAELGDLTTSHTDDMQPNPAYPPELQPRDRGRAGAMARNLQLEAELNPKLLMSDVGAGAGAPIVSPDGIVESGNGRTIALRRAAAKGAPAYDAYKAQLAAAGYDHSGMTAPALVRMRTEPLSGVQRAALAHEMNADVTERMSATEQATADAARLPANAFDLVEEGRSPTTSRAFTRAFIEHVAPDQVGQLVDREGRLSPEGARRIKAAVLQRAFGDAGLVSQIFEGEETPARRLGEAVAEAAPAWAKLRALATSGEIPRALDITDALTSAMDLVRHAAREGVKLGDLVADRLGQTELFGGESISPATEAFLRLFYRDGTFTRLTAAEKVSWALKDYARQAAEVKPGPDLFGDTPDENTARAILRNVAAKFASGETGDLDVRAPGKSDGGSEPAKPLVLDLRRPGEPGDGRPGDVSPPAGEGAGVDRAELGEREPANATAARAPRVTGQSIIAGDPELRAIAEDTERLASENGIAPADDPKQAPDTIAEALRAAAVCLAEEVG